MAEGVYRQNDGSTVFPDKARQLKNVLYSAQKQIDSKDKYSHNRSE